MQTANPPHPKPRASRLRYLVVAFMLLFIAAPFAFRMLADWQRERALDAVIREMDAEDPHWRWPDLIAQLPAPPPDEVNAAVQVKRQAKANSLDENCVTENNEVGSHRLRPPMKETSSC